MNKNLVLFFVISFTTISLLYGSEQSLNNERSFMTFNIRRKGPEQKEERQWPNRKQLVTNIIKSNQPNILGLQEVTPIQLKDLQKTVSSDYCFFGTSRGSSWLGFGKNEFNPIAFNRTQFKLIKHGTFKLNDHPFWFFNVKRYGWLPRICTWGLFEDTRTHQRFYVYNTHLDNHYSEARLNGLQQIMDHVSRHNNSYPVILMGDFNANVIKDVPLKSLLQEHGFIHTKKVASMQKGPDMTMHHWHEGNEEYIDHILIKNVGPWLIVNHEVIQEDSKGLYPSDHRPVLVMIKS